MATGKPRLCAENFFDTIRNPSHVVTASSYVVGNEPWRVGAARREARNHWKPTTDNTDAWVKADCGVVKTADFFALYADHNLAGYSIYLEASNDDFTTKTRVVEITVPSSTAPSSRLAVPPYARTWDGCLVGRFQPQTARYWRLYVPAMGASLRPQVVGLQVGQSVQFTNGAIFPYSDARVELAYDEVLSPALWAAATRKAQRRTSGNTPLAIPLELGELDLVERHLTGIFWKGSVMWIVTNDQRAERSVLAYAPRGDHGPTQTAEDPQGLLLVEWREHQPKEQ
jgi:hypothetical protein